MATAGLSKSLPEQDRDLLARLGHLADSQGVVLWLVGGSVRDGLLGRPVADLDITSETPAAQLGAKLADATGATLRSVSQFGTIKLRLGRRSIDLATCRTEIYERPGSLPKVSPAGITADLARRDFSVNAMAACLAPGRFGELLDPVDGQRDLERRIVRALHEQSFQDDATRVLRAIRYASRLGFDLESNTRKWLIRDLQYLNKISSARLRREFERTLTEPMAGQALLLGMGLGAIQEICSEFELETARNCVLQAISRGLSGLALLGVLVYALTPESARALQDRLAATNPQSELIASVIRLREIAPGLTRATSGSEIDHLVGSSPVEAIKAVAAATDNDMVRRNLDRYLGASKKRALLTGDELLRLGVKPGPPIGKMARELRHAMIDRMVETRTEAALFVLKRLEEEEL